MLLLRRLLVIVLVSSTMTMIHILSFPFVTRCGLVPEVLATILASEAYSRMGLQLDILSLDVTNCDAFLQIDAAVRIEVLVPQHISM